MPGSIPGSWQSIASSCLQNSLVIISFIVLVLPTDLRVKAIEYFLFGFDLNQYLSNTKMFQKKYLKINLSSATRKGFKSFFCHMERFLTFHLPRGKVSNLSSATWKGFQPFICHMDRFLTFHLPHGKVSNLSSATWKGF